MGLREKEGANTESGREDNYRKRGNWPQKGREKSLRAGIWEQARKELGDEERVHSGRSEEKGRGVKAAEFGQLWV